MPIITPSLPSDGDEAIVEPYNAAINAILGVINGGIDSSNVSAGSLPWSVMSNAISNAIPVAAMVDNGNLVKSRKDTGVNGVIPGTGTWSADAPGSTLNGSMTALTVYINGNRIIVSAVTAHVFTASKDTYIDVLDNGNGTGTLGYTAVANGATSGFALASNSVRIAKVITGTTIVSASSIIQTGYDAVNTPIYPTGTTSASLLQNPYKFCVYRSASGNVTNTLTVLSYDTKIFDTGNNIDVVTNKGRFTAPVAGFYHFYWQVGIPTAGTDNLAILYRNGSAAAWGNENVGGGSHGSILVESNANDYWEIYIVSSGTLALNVGSGPIKTYFGGELAYTT